MVSVMLDGVDSVMSICNCFIADDIRIKDVTILDVRQKIANSSVLESIDPKKVYDKVRSMWKAMPKQDHILQSIPRETAEEKIERMFENDAISTNSMQQSSTDLSALGHRKILTEEQVKTILKLCKPMSDVGAFTKMGIVENMSKIGKGQEILEKFDVEQIISRLKYEKLKQHWKSTSRKNN